MTEGVVVVELSEIENKSVTQPRVLSNAELKSHEVEVDSVVVVDVSGVVVEIGFAEEVEPSLGCMVVVEFSVLVSSDRNYQHLLVVSHRW